MKFQDMNAQIDEFLPEFKGDRKPLYALLDNAYGLGYKDAGIVWNNVLLNSEATRKAMAAAPAAQIAAKNKPSVQQLANDPFLAAKEWREPASTAVPVPKLQPMDPQGTPRPIPGDAWGQPAPTKEPPRDVGADCWHAWTAEGPFLERCTKCKSVRPKP